MSKRLEFQRCKLRKRRGTARADGAGHHRAPSHAPGSAGTATGTGSNGHTAVPGPGLTPEGHREVAGVTRARGARGMQGVQLCTALLSQGTQRWSSQGQLQAQCRHCPHTAQPSPALTAPAKHPDTHCHPNQEPEPRGNGTLCCWRGHRVWLPQDGLLGTGAKGQ